MEAREGVSKPGRPGTGRVATEGVCEARERECKEGDRVEVLGTCSQAEGSHLAKPTGSPGLFQAKALSLWAGA